MADRMLTFPSRSSAACTTKTSSAVTDAPEPGPVSPSARSRRLVLVKGTAPRQHAALAQPSAAAQRREWRTREIVAQVEREMAALARRSAADRLAQRSPVDRLIQLAPQPLWTRRDTPWSVLQRVLRVVRAEDAGGR